MMEAKLNNLNLSVFIGDLLALPVDALVYPTQTNLDMSSGLGRRILDRGGNVIAQEVSTRGFCEEGQAIITSAGNLSVRYIIHAVIPRMGSGNERGKLAGSVWNSLKLAINYEITSIAFPALATGRRGGFPIEACARIMAQKIVDFTFEETGSLQKIIVCLRNHTAFELFDQAFQREVREALDDHNIED